MLRSSWIRDARIGVAIAALAGTFVAGAARPGAAEPAETLPLCAQADAALSATIDTKVAKAGDRFAFTTIQPIDFAGAMIPAGTTGVGTIATLDHSKSQGHSGYLVLEARYLTLSDGTHVPVTLRPADDGHAAAFVRAGSSDAGFLGFPPFYIGTAAGVYNAFHHGKDAAVVAQSTLPLIVGDAYYEGTCRVAVDRR